LPDPRPRIARLLLGALVLLAAVVLWRTLAARGERPAALPPLAVEVTRLDVIDAFDRGAPEVSVVAQDAGRPLLCTPARFEKDATLASDDGHKVIRAHAESAFEVRVDGLRPGARLIARTLVHSAHRKDPELVDPLPVTFRILVDGAERASLSSDYVRQMDVESPYDQVLRTLDVPLQPPPSGVATLRFETTRAGQPAPAEPLPEGAVPAEPCWWELRVEQPVPVPRQAASRTRPNVLVLMVDTLSARHMSLYGAARPTTPALADFAQRGTVFERAVSAASWTLPSVATHLTGLPPNTHGVLGDSRSYLMDGLTTWPEMLRQSGLAGLAVVGNPLVCQGGNFQQGFETWVQANEENADQLNARLLEWLDGPLADGRWFAYVHYMEPHAPYSAPGPARERFTNGYQERRSFAGNLPGQLQREEIPPFQPDEQQHIVDLYDGEVAYFDAAFARLRDALSNRGLLENTIVVLLADHGEELFQHGRLGHGFSLHGEQIEVPLLLAGPGVPTARVPEQVGTAGLANTLLLLAGVQPLPDGAPALFPRPAPGAAPGGPVFSLVRTQLFGPRRPIVSAIDGAGRKVIATLDEQGTPQSAEWYDLTRDPEERAPLGAAEGATLDAGERAAFEDLQQQALAWYASTAARRPAGQQPLSPEVQSGLEQLGYVGGAAGRNGH